MFFIFRVIYENSFAMLPPITPFSLIGLSITPFEGPITIFLIIFVVTYIRTAIWPCEFSLAVHFAVKPHSCVFTHIIPSISTLAAKCSIFELAVVRAEVWPRKCALSGFFTFQKIPNKNSSIMIILSGLSFFYAFAKFACICHIGLDLHPVAMFYPIYKVSFVDCSIWLYQAPIAICFTMSPAAGKERAVWLLEYAVSVGFRNYISCPFATVYFAFLNFSRSPNLSWDTVCEYFEFKGWEFR